MKLEKKPPILVEAVYTQSWVSGVEGGGSGTNLFIETTDRNIVLDSVYFRNSKVKLETKPSDDTLYIGRFGSNVYPKQSEGVENFPFQLENDECVVSYNENGTTKYFKFTGIKERPTETLPMTPLPNNN
ncbi:hypothetical protein [Winogradskyella ursingii]|uniref:hypothetical protein n=1 Tax=Winogradskyella ursingii TaxID=2686079 RepID=UPI0015CA85FA|nr:hypothetical protein [Winogradskyella ursingii]